MKQVAWITMLACSALIAACGGSAPDAPEAPATPDAPAPAEEPEVIAAPETPDVPEEASLALPDALKDLVMLPEGFILTKIDVIDEAKKQYHIEADTRDNVDKVQVAIIKMYKAQGWEEDMNMSQKGNTTTSYIKDGFMVFMDANKGNLGSIVTINTGMV